MCEIVVMYTMYMCFRIAIVGQKTRKPLVFPHLCKHLQEGTCLKDLTCIPIAGQMITPDFHAGGVGEVLCNCRELFCVGKIKPSHQIVVCATGSNV